jgi:hypothetical protein
MCVDKTVVKLSIRGVISCQGRPEQTNAGNSTKKRFVEDFAADFLVNRKSRSLIWLAILCEVCNTPWRPVSLIVINALQKHTSESDDLVKSCRVLRSMHGTTKIANRLKEIVDELKITFRWHRHLLETDSNLSKCSQLYTWLIVKKTFKFKIGVLWATIAQKQQLSGYFI